MKKIKSKRTFFFSPLLAEASICVEAALSFSFFLFFIINIYSIIFLFISYTNELENLQQYAKKEASYAYMWKEKRDEEDLLFYEKEIPVRSFSSLLGYQGGRVLVRCAIKPWTGYGNIDFDRRREEEMVYVTDYGEVFHRDRACTYLSLSIQMIHYEKIKSKGYLPCEICFDTKESGFMTLVYITNYGERYHKTIGCKSLKRTVKIVPLSEVDGRPSCSKCG